MTAITTQSVLRGAFGIGALPDRVICGSTAGTAATEDPPAIPGVDRLPDLALARSAAVVVQKSDHPLGRAGVRWEDRVRGEV
jgi:hypothetical protein